VASSTEKLSWRFTLTEKWKERLKLGPNSPCRRFDIVVLGGAFSGAAAANLLLRERPDLKILLVEKSRAFDSKVGEATTEMSAMFLTRRLALWEHLELDHLPKEGLRYWFTNAQVRHHWEAAETGGFQRSAVPSFQLRRDRLDQHLLDRAVAAGAELWRPARAVDVKLGRFDHWVKIERGTERETVQTRWVLDATGRATFLSKRLGLLVRNEEHPTAAMWARWQGVRHLDDLAALGPEPFAQRNLSSRRLATNHYMRRGSWTWFIPLGNGETSIGVVFDRRLVHLDRETDKRAAYKRFLAELNPAAELLEGATMREEDFRFYSYLPYVSRKYLGEGWALLGDAAAFLDPYYSPGLDHASFTIESTVQIVLADFAGSDISQKAEIHNETFLRSYWRFFRAVYQDKYFYMGESDLLSASFLLDTAQYYIFVVIPAYRFLGHFHWEPVLGRKEAFFNYFLMCLYNRRLKALADLRLELGVAGCKNAARRITAYYSLGFAPYRMALKGVGLWFAAELSGLALRAKKWLGLLPRAESSPLFPKPEIVPLVKESSETSLVQDR
jgi:flavin-dependent dehydrogenase